MWMIDQSSAGCSMHTTVWTISSRFHADGLGWRMIAGPDPSAFKGSIMASITIRNLDDDIEQRLRVRAAEHGRSMEEEVLDILRKVASEELPVRSLAAAIQARVRPEHRAELELPAREPMRSEAIPANPHARPDLEAFRSLLKRKGGEPPREGDERES
jgi:plasmid stability protein